MKNNYQITLKTGILLILITSLLNFSNLFAQASMDLFLEEQAVDAQNIAQNNILIQKLNTFSEIQKYQLATKSTNKAQFLLFKAIQKTFLKKYTPYQSLRNTVQNAAYDCLSGTAIYALVLQNLGYKFEIWEMQHHIFLMISLENGEQILVESTDPVHGFVLGQKNINRRIASYRQEKNIKQNFYQSRHNFEGKITLKELAGLQYYNLAVVDFNSQKFDICAKKLEKALSLYNSERSKELLMLTIAYLPPKQQNELWLKYGFANFAVATK